MTRLFVMLAVILVLVTFTMPAAAQETGAVLDEPESECTCPKPGRWMAKNLEGWMRCTGTLGFKRKLKKEDPNPGIFWIPKRIARNSSSRLWKERVTTS